MKIFRGDEVLVSGDLATNPEVATYSAAAIPAGTYAAQVCPFDAASVVAGQYALAVSTSDTAAPGAGDLAANPRWRWFTANPTLDSPTETPDNSIVGLLERRGRLHRPADPAAQRRRLRAVGHRQRPAHLHDRRQQRQHPRGVGQPAHPRRAAPGARLR